MALTKEQLADIRYAMKQIPRDMWRIKDSWIIQLLETVEEQDRRIKAMTRKPFDHPGAEPPDSMLQILERLKREFPGKEVFLGISDNPDDVRGYEILVKAGIRAARSGVPYLSSTPPEDMFKYEMNLAINKIHQLYQGGAGGEG